MTTIQNLKIADLKPYPGNPRDNDGAVPGVVASIRQYGFIGAIIVNKDKVIINGHTRVKAMKELGADTIPAIVVEHLTPEQERALRIADNKTGEVATWNMDLLKAELKALQEAGFASFWAATRSRSGRPTLTMRRKFRRRRCRSPARCMSSAGISSSAATPRRRRTWRRSVATARPIAG